MGDRNVLAPSGVQAVEDVHVDALMAVIHTLSSAGATRPTNELDIRQRLIVQSLGLHGAQPTAVIGSRLGLTASTMTGLVDRLESLGFVKRRAHPSDRRIKLVELTTLGDSAFDQERAFYASLLELTLGTLGSESVESVLDALAALAVLDQKATT